MTAHAADELSREAGARREVTVFVIGPVMLCFALAALNAAMPVRTPLPGQAALLGPFLMAQWLTCGSLGVWLAARTGLTPQMPFDWRGWRILLLAAIVPGILLGAGQLALDGHYQLSETANHTMGVRWINPELPGSLALSTSAAVMLECWYRIAPIPFLTFLVSDVLLRGRYRRAVFWSTAVLTSLIEPSQQLGSALQSGQGYGAQLVLLAMTLYIFLFNLLEAVEYRKYGWTAPIILRCAFYYVFHTFGPYLFAPNNFLYPGPH